MGNSTVVTEPVQEDPREEPLQFDNTLQDATALLWASKAKLEPAVFGRLLDLSAAAYLGKTREVKIFSQAVHEALGLPSPSPPVFSRDVSPLEMKEKSDEVSEEELRKRYSEIQKAHTYSAVLIDFSRARRLLWRNKSYLDPKVFDCLRDQEIEASCGNRQDKVLFQKIIFEAFLADPKVPIYDSRFSADSSSLLETEELDRELVSKARQFIFKRTVRTVDPEEKRMWTNMLCTLGGKEILQDLNAWNPNWQELP